MLHQDFLASKRSHTQRGNVGTWEQHGPTNKNGGFNELNGDLNGGFMNLNEIPSESTFASRESCQAGEFDILIHPNLNEFWPKRRCHIFSQGFTATGQHEFHRRCIPIFCPFQAF